MLRVCGSCPSQWLRLIPFAIGIGVSGSCILVYLVCTLRYDLGFPIRERGDDLEGDGSTSCNVGGVSVIFNLYALRVGAGMSLLSLRGGPQVGIDCTHDVLSEGRPDRCVPMMFSIAFIIVFLRWSR